jgi:murein L,D-transpeptidase YcbB/YkuD
MKSNGIIILSVLLLMCHSCGNNAQVKTVERDTTINETTSFNNLFLDSNTLHQFFVTNPRYGKYEKQFDDFYKERNYEYAWFDSSGIGEQAHGFINLLNSTISTMQDSSLYNSRLVSLYSKFEDSVEKKHTADEVLNTELLLTGQFFHYTAKMYKGTDSNIADLGWFIPRKKINLTALLDSVILTKNTQVDQFASLNEQYSKLSAFLPSFYALQKQGNWDSIPQRKKPLHLNDDTVIIATIKDRLHRLGDLAEIDSTTRFDSALFTAVKSFQRRMGLSVDGAIGPKMIDEINITPTKRIQQILVNLERMRWMPLPHKEHEFIYVNIPEYKMYVYNEDTLKFDMNVIVGTAANSTVIFSGDLKYIVFAPYWKVPDKIVRTEILPAMEKDTGYLRRNNMERTGGPDTLPSIRQLPGPLNSLGKVKFLFPNNFDIYFHDTPNRNLFSASSRSFSHGCIRLGEPKKLAEFLLRNDTSWNEIRIDTLMNSLKEKWVTLPGTIPVVITYFTAFVDDSGALNFRKDIYKHDERLADKLFARQ